ncbi:MAG: DUF5652 family protein [Methanosarcinaceae archaeon]
MFEFASFSIAFIGLILVVVFWELFWKGIALWKAAQNNQKYWFISILVLNTGGILPILYIFMFQSGKKRI